MKNRIFLALPALFLLAACGKNGSTGSSDDGTSMAGSKVFGHWIDSSVVSSVQHSKPLKDDFCLAERQNRQVLNPVLSVDWQGNVSFYPDDRAHRKFASLKNGRLYLASQSNPDFPKGWTVGDGATVQLQGDSLSIAWQGEDVASHQTKEMSLNLTRAKGDVEKKFHKMQYDCVRGHLNGRLNGQELGEGIFAAGKPVRRKAVFTPKSGAPVTCQYSADKQSLIVSARPASVEHGEIDSSPLANADFVASASADASAGTSTSTGTGTSTDTSTGTSPPLPPAKPAQPQSFTLTIPAATALDGSSIALDFGKSPGLELAIAANKEDSFRGNCQLRIRKTADVLDGVISCPKMEYFPGGTDSKQAVDIQGEFGCDMPTPN